MSRTRALYVVSSRSDATQSSVIKLESRPGHQEWTLDMPLLYLCMIMEECVASAENVYPCDTQLKTFKDLHNIKHGPEESIADYTKRVRVQWELLTTSAPIFYQRINNKIHEDFDVMDSTERVALNGTTDELFVFYIMVVGADTNRFGELIERLQQSYSDGNNSYPLTIKDAKLYLERTEDNKTLNNKKEASKNNSIRLASLRRR
jgi:hypothetical protein